MSYDLLLVGRAPGQPWEDALAARAAAANRPGEPAEIPVAARQFWDRLAGGLQARWPALQRHDGARSVVLDDPDTGTQVHLFLDEAAVSVPYWHDDAAGAVMEELRAIAMWLEEETGFEAYDPQLGRGVRETELSEAADALGDTSSRLPDLVGECTPVHAPPPSRRKNWRFWRR